MRMRVKFVTIPVTDQERALKFYTEQVGFAVITDQPFGDGMRWIELEPPGAETRVVLFTADAHKLLIGTPSNITFGTDDVRKTYTEMKARGVEFTGPPTEQPWGTFAQFRDPDGNTFILGSLD
jgi:predicted enzyme related to lactoylglutathione lyase